MEHIIKEYRDAHSLTQKEMAELLRITQSSVANIESGYRGISKSVAINLNSLDPEAFPLSKTIRYTTS